MHRLGVSAAGFRSLEVQESVQADQETKLQLTLQPMMGSIELLALQPGAIVEASAGRIEGNRVLDVPVGSQVNLSVRRKNGGQTWKHQLTMRSEALIRVEVPPVAPSRRGSLFVNSRPFSKVYVNGRSKGRTPLTLKLRPGSYRLMLKRPDGKTHSRRVKVGSGRKVNVVYRWP